MPISRLQPCYDEWTRVTAPTLKMNASENITGEEADFVWFSIKGGTGPVCQPFLVPGGATLFDSIVADPLGPGGEPAEWHSHVSPGTPNQHTTTYKAPRLVCWFWVSG